MEILSNNMGFSAYIYLVEQLMVKNYYWWVNFVWKGMLPLKIKCFTWLCFKRRILTWDGLEMRGYSGPGRCCLCVIALETVDHFFGECKFFLYIWKEVCKSLNVGFTWDKSCLEANIFCLHNLHSLSADIPYLVLWEVWGVKNIFSFRRTILIHFMLVLGLSIGSMIMAS